MIKNTSWQIISVYALVYLVIFLLKNNEIVTSEFVYASFYAGLLNIINTFLALIAFKLTLKKNNQIFLMATIGGMGARIFFMLLLIILIIKFLNIDLYGFILVFFVFYFMLLIIEVVYFNRLVKEKNSINNANKPG